jgi:NAD(P)-dependent dehydrogenase (short-subunit alcohol dehydrogenase family)
MLETKELKMKELRDKVAVITGAASGIGRGIAERCVQEGMKLVISDIEKAALEKTNNDLKSGGGDVLALVTDVSKANDIELLAQKTLEKFGAVHLLFNNAGIEVRGTVWEQTLADWEWIINVHLWGVIHGIRIFVPIMLRQNTECHIVNTASIAALISGPTLGSYKVTKSGVFALSETLYHELKMHDAKIGVSVLYPGFVRSRLIDAERNRPPEYTNQLKERVLPQYEYDMVDYFREQNQKAMSPKEYADHVFIGIKENKLYISAHPEFDESVRLRMEEILQQKNPGLREM